MRLSQALVPGVLAVTVLAACGSDPILVDGQLTFSLLEVTSDSIRVEIANSGRVVAVVSPCYVEREVRNDAGEWLHDAWIGYSDCPTIAMEPIPAGGSWRAAFGWSEVDLARTRLRFTVGPETGSRPSPGAVPFITPPLGP